MTSMQNVGLVGLMTVDWPANLAAVFAFCQFLLLDIDSFGFSCVAGPLDQNKHRMVRRIDHMSTWYELSQLSCFGT